GEFCVKLLEATIAAPAWASSCRGRRRTGTCGALKPQPWQHTAVKGVLDTSPPECLLVAEGLKPLT
ncbi:MAG: hypothetical protein QW808_03985, partial [Desulfurococcaceae archaeon]